MNKTSSITSCNCFAIRQAARFVSQLYERHYAGTGLTANQFSLLAFVHDAGEAGILEMADAMVMDRTTLVRAIKPLERDGHLISEPEGKGSRKLLYRLTDSGGEKLAEAAKGWYAAQAEYVELVGQENADLLRSLLLAIPTGVRA